MVVVRREYQRFLAWLKTQPATDDTRRMANLVDCHLPELASLTAARSARSLRLIDLAHQTFNGLPAQLPAELDTPSISQSPWKALNRLEVGPFRGFRQAEHFQFDRPVILVYGPNGSGKSCLCEALEYVLLGGHVEGADACRIGTKKYLENAWSHGFEPPKLFATSDSGDKVPVEGREDAFRFCFVEKNRIEDFARLSAKPPTEQSKLLATLFGVDAFDEFVRGFNDSLASKLDLTGRKRAEYEMRRKSIEADVEEVRKEPDDRKELARKGQGIADQLELGLEFNLALARLGTPEKPGRLQELDTLLERAIPQQIGLTRHSATKTLRLVLTKDERVRDLEQQMRSRRTEVSFKRLFQAIIDLQSLSPDRCPACDSPLAGPRSVERNPFDKARKGLADLAELASLEAKLEDARRELKTTSSEFLVGLGKVRDFLKTDQSAAPSAAEALRDLAKESNETWWSFLLMRERPTWGSVVAALRAIELQDQKGAQEQTRKAELRLEKVRLDQIRTQIITHQALEKKYEDDLAAAKSRIATFDETQASLVSSLPEEEALVRLNARINSAYDQFLFLLKQYRDDLPGKLASGLNETVMDFYNRFNRRDPESDRVVEMQLPSRPEERIGITFAGNPSLRLDALSVLSEGHIRCLGLAILLAKNVQSHCPVLVFDDAVNAIDPDHKEGIRRTIFEGNEFANKQVIVTCHGEEFLKDIENMLGPDAQKRIRSYVFLPHEGDRRIRIDSKPNTRNYLVSAQDKLARREIRDAVAEARRAFEHLTNVIWGRLVKVSRGEVHLKHKGPKVGSPIVPVGVAA